MDNQRKYAAISIPRRVDGANAGAASPVSADSAAPTVAVESRFAEIEIDAGSTHISDGEKALRFFSSVTPPEPVEQRAYDPLRLKFYEMRSLASDRPFARDDSELFFRQAKFMEDFTDNYEGDAKFFMYFPYYQHMGYEQLRTYFTWRAKARNGDMPVIPGSYVFLYVYELLNNIGVYDSADGFDKLLTVWHNCIGYAPALENYMPQWIKDYHIYYGLQGNFADFVKEHDLAGYYSLTFLYDSDDGKYFDFWSRASGYTVSRSKFYLDGNEQLFKDCFSTVLNGIRMLCAKNNIGIEKLFIYGSGKRMPWQPFKQALFYHFRQQPDRVVEIPGAERYYCKNNRWSANLPVYYSTQNDFIGYIIKKTEECLRSAVKYKHKLTAEPNVRYNGTLHELKVLEGGRAALDNAIENAVAEFFRNKNRTVVTVDYDNLARIRDEALDTQAKLIVPESGREFGIRNSEFGITGDEREFGIWDSEFGIRDTEPEITEDEEEFGISSDGSVIGNRDTDPAITGDEREFEVDEKVDDVWEALRKALSATELEALGIILRGGDIKAFADGNGIMLEVLADGINEKAVDYIGDSILETVDGMAIYNDYITNVSALL